MQINNIRFMSFRYGDSTFTRADVLLPHPVKIRIGTSRQCHVPINENSISSDIETSLKELEKIVKSRGFAMSECTAPTMLKNCQEPTENLQKEIKKALS